VPRGPPRRAERRVDGAEPAEIPALAHAPPIVASQAEAKTTSSFVTSPAVLLEGLFQTLPPTSGARSGAPSRDAGLGESWPSAIFTTAC
jgi:hypothetical protein